MKIIQSLMGALFESYEKTQEGSAYPGQVSGILDRIYATDQREIAEIIKKLNSLIPTVEQHLRDHDHEKY
jgi:hypothetical protein